MADSDGEHKQQPAEEDATRDSRPDRQNEENEEHQEEKEEQQETNFVNEGTQYQNDQVLCLFSLFSGGTLFSR